MMQKWFEKAKLGIFLHWGIYSVEGISESWSFGNGDISYDQYMEQLKGFTASKYNPHEWAKLFKQSGAKYVVLTTKHHDGVALFDTKYSDLNVVKKTPAARDLVAPYCEALREEGLKTGLYFTNTDWSSIDHLKVILDMSEEEIEEIRKKPFVYWKRWGEVIEPRNVNEDGLGEEEEKEEDVNPDLKESWDKFMTLYRGQIKELLSNYGPVDLLWFDVMLQRRGYSWDPEGTKALIESLSPKTVINKRLGGYGDYDTPEMYVPLEEMNGPWEMCTTFSEAWGFRYNDKTYKDIRQIIRLFCEAISKGGNMLISLGPDSEGQIPKECEELLIKMGQWTSKYEEAIYPTNKGIGIEYFLGGSTLTEDKKTLYIFPYDISSGRLRLNGIRNELKKITSLKNGRELKHTRTGGAPWVNIPTDIWIEVEADDIDDVCTVIKIEFNEEIDLVQIKDKVNSMGQM